MGSRKGWWSESRKHCVERDAWWDLARVQDIGSPWSPHRRSRGGGLNTLLPPSNLLPVHTKDQAQQAVRGQESCMVYGYKSVFLGMCLEGEGASEVASGRSSSVTIHMWSLTEGGLCQESHVLGWVIVSSSEMGNRGRCIKGERTWGILFGIQFLKCIDRFMQNFY